MNFTMARIASILKSRVLIAVTALLFGLAMAPEFVFYAGTWAPIKPEAQQGSPVYADNGNDVSRLGRSYTLEPDTRLEVCDHSSNFDEAVGLWGDGNPYGEGYKKDTNGAGAGCGAEVLEGRSPNGASVHRTCIVHYTEQGDTFGCGPNSQH